jgi:hypothetical protein
MFDRIIVNAFINLICSSNHTHCGGVHYTHTIFTHMDTIFKQKLTKQKTGSETELPHTDGGHTNETTMLADDRELSLPWWKWKHIKEMCTKNPYVDKKLKINDGICYHAAGMLPLVFSDKGLGVCMARRTKEQDYTFLGGKRELGEWVKQTASREVWEETGRFLDMGQIQDCVRSAWTVVWGGTSKYALFMSGVEFVCDVGAEYQKRKPTFDPTYTPYDGLRIISVEDLEVAATKRSTTRAADDGYPAGSVIRLHPFVEHMLRNTNLLDTLLGIHNVVTKRGSMVFPRRPLGIAGGQTAPDQ